MAASDHLNSNLFPKTEPSAESKETIYHGSPHRDFKVGDIISGEHGENSLVYGTNQAWWASMYANKTGEEGRIYTVEPVGKLNKYMDPDIYHDAKKFFNSPDMETWEYSAPAWRVTGHYYD